MGWAAPVANLAGAIGGALIGRSGQSQALKAQERATNAQLQYQREQDAAKNERYRQAMTVYDRDRQSHDQVRRALLQHYYGISLPGGSGPAPAGGGQVQAGGGGAMSGGQPAAGLTLGELMDGGAGVPKGFGAPAAPAAEAPGPMAEGDDLFDWKRYGVV